tara:strand:+ start:60671 stop:62140 length:1470 start_codon:yes stop_codon:yes gene_type:complete
MKNSPSWRFACPKIFLVCLLLPLLVAHLSAKNVILIVADDLSPRLGCYDGPAITPHLDLLAEEGTLFQHAYSQATLCMPSRASFLTGLEPGDVGTRDNNKKSHFRGYHPDLLTLPQYLEEKGFVSVGLGKTFHVSDQSSWTEEILERVPAEEQYAKKENREILKANQAAGKRGWASVGPLVESADVPDEAYPDGKVTERTVEKIAELKGQDFFLMVGFDRPHRPFTAPKQYWDLYDGRDLDSPVPGVIPEEVPDLAVKTKRTKALRPGDARYTRDELQRLGYLASVSYIDAQVGKILEAVRENGIEGETLIIFTADHGFHLGENGQWDKSLLFETSCHVPLIVLDPELPPSETPLAQMVELVDLFPTVLDFLGLPAPHDLAGESLLMYVRDPENAVEGASFSEALRDERGKNNAGNWDGSIEGKSIRRGNYRLNRWYNTQTGQLIAVELYDYSLPIPEERNLSDDPEYQDVRIQLLAELEAKWPMETNL